MTDRCGSTINSEPVQDGKFHERAVIEVHCSGHHDHAGIKHEGVRGDSGRIITWVGMDDDDVQ